MNDLTSLKWSSNRMFLMAAIGAAVGLGNIWKFPYMAGANGGGAFVLVYLVCVVVVAIPILAAELMIGRRGGGNPVNAVAAVAAEFGASPRWRVIGWMSVLAAFLILSFFGGIASWALAYIPQAASGALDGITAAGAEALFDRLKGDAVQIMVWHAGLTAAAVWVVAHGIRGGIERTVRLVMPALFAIILILFLNAVVAGDFAAGFDFMFRADFSKINSAVLLAAVGQAFLSIGVASGIMLAYGAYLPAGISIGRAAVIISLADTLVAILAGLAIFPLVFAHGLDPAGGPGLAFVTLPLAFQGMVGGRVLAVMFYVLLVLATFTSTIAVLEPTVSWAAQKFRCGRTRAAVALGGLSWMVGQSSLLSFSAWRQVYPLAGVPGLESATFFDLADHFISSLLLPAGGILIAVLAGWKISRSVACSELGLGDGPFFAAWRVLIRVVAPLALGAMFVGYLVL